MDIYDSCYIEKDTLINNNTYYKYVYNGNGFQNVEYLRDSLSYTVSSHGDIVFSSEDFGEVFSSYVYGPNLATPDTLYVTEKMDYKNETTIVEAGTFVTSTFRIVFRFPSGQYKRCDTRYAKNVGIVSRCVGIYYFAPLSVEQRLLRYHLE